LAASAGLAASARAVHGAKNVMAHESAASFVVIPCGIVVVGI
jgi:hypothetical protein